MARRRAPSLTIVLICVCAGLVPVRAQSGQTDGDLYRRMAVDLTLHATRLPESDVDGRRELATRAAALDPDLADPLLVLADLLRGDQRSVRRRAALLTDALDREFVSRSRRAAVTDRARLMLQTGHPAEALSLLHAELSRDTDTPPLVRMLGESQASELDEADLLYVEALVAAGGPWYGGRVLADLRDRFPADERLAGLSWARSGAVTLPMLEWTDAAEVAGLLPSAVYRDMLLAGVPAARVAPVVARYRAAGGADPVVEAVAAAAGLDGDVPDHAWRTDKFVWEVWASRSDESTASSAAAERALALVSDADSTVLELDVDRDGFWEERYHLEGGRLVAWQADPDEDGVVSAALRLDDPSVTVLVRHPYRDEVVELFCARYPSVSRVRWLAGDGGREWRPATPIPVDFGVAAALDADLWETLTGRVVLADDLATRFDRQQYASGSRQLDGAVVRDLRDEAGRLELLQ